MRDLMHKTEYKDRMNRLREGRSLKQPESGASSLLRRDFKREREDLSASDGEGDEDCHHHHRFQSTPSDGATGLLGSSDGHESRWMEEAGIPISSSSKLQQDASQMRCVGQDN